MLIRIYQSLIIISVFLTMIVLSSVYASDYGEAKKYEIPMRKVSIIVTEEGYYPKAISLFQGEKLKIYVTGTTNNPSCLMLPEKNIFLSAIKGEISEGIMTFNKAGTYKFYCPTGNIRGRVVVIERQEEMKKRKRKIASKNVVKLWKPKEE